MNRRRALQVCCAGALVAGGLQASDTSGFLVFVANRGRNWHLFGWRVDGEPIQLTNSRPDIRMPALGPGTSPVAYTTGDGTLWLLDLPSRAPRKLGARFANGSYGSPNWINSDTLAYTLYTVTPPTEDSDIYAYSLTDGKQRALIRHTGSQDYPSASPAGDRLAYMSSVTTTVVGLGTNITQQLWIADLRTGRVEQVTGGGSRDTKPTWSPDGHSIAFSSDRDGNPEIWVVELASRKHTKLTTGKGEKTDPCWSPDGQQILYVTTATGKRSLETVNVTTGETRQLRPFGNQDVEIRDPAWGR